MKDYPYSFECTGDRVPETVNQTIDMLDRKEDLVKTLIKDSHDTQQEKQSACVFVAFSGLEDMDTSLHVSDGAVRLNHASGNTSIEIACPMWPYGHTPWEDAFDALVNGLVRENNRLVRT